MDFTWCRDVGGGTYYVLQCLHKEQQPSTQVALSMLQP